MTERQKEMLEKRVLQEYLTGLGKDLTPEDVKYTKVHLVTNIDIAGVELLRFSHYVAYIGSPREELIYIPKERFLVEEDEANVDQA